MVDSIGFEDCRTMNNCVLNFTGHSLELDYSIPPIANQVTLQQRDDHRVKNLPTNMIIYFSRYRN